MAIAAIIAPSHGKLVGNDDQGMVSMLQQLQLPAMSPVAVGDSCWAEPHPYVIVQGVLALLNSHLQLCWVFLKMKKDEEEKQKAGKLE